MMALQALKITSSIRTLPTIHQDHNRCFVVVDVDGMVADHKSAHSRQRLAVECESQRKIGRLKWEMRRFVVHTLNILDWLPIFLENGRFSAGYGSSANSHYM